MPIDTTKPVDASQWDTFAIQDTSKRYQINAVLSRRYFNIVAVYEEGNSGFLTGWTCNVAMSVNIRQEPAPAKATQSTANFIGSPVANSIFDLAGRQITTASSVKGHMSNSITANQSIGTGCFIIHANSGKKAAGNQPWILPR